MFPEGVLDILQFDTLHSRPDCQRGVGQNLGLDPADVRNDSLNFPLSSSFGKTSSCQTPRIDLNSEEFFCHKPPTPSETYSLTPRLLQPFSGAPGRTRP